MKTLLAAMLGSLLAMSMFLSTAHATETNPTTLVGVVKSVDGEYSFVETSEGQVVLTVSDNPLSTDLVGKTVTLIVEPRGDTFVIKEVTSVSNNS